MGEKISDAIYTFLHLGEEVPLNTTKVTRVLNQDT